MQTEHRDWRTERFVSRGMKLVSWFVLATLVAGIINGNSVWKAFVYACFIGGVGSLIFVVIFFARKHLSTDR